MGYLVNLRNFLRWDDLGNNPDADTSMPIATGYNIDPQNCDYLPVMKLGEATRFYINALEGTPWITDALANLKLNLINTVTGATVKADCAPLQKDTFTDSNGDTTYNLYAEVVLAAVDVPPAFFYHFTITGAAAKLWMRSNMVQVVAITDLETLRKTSSIAYRHDRSWYGFRFQAMPDFTCLFRLHVNEIGEQEESSVEVYKEQTTGKRRQYNEEMDLVKTVECYNFDTLAYSAAIVMFASQDLQINGRSYKKKGALQKQNNQKYKKNKSTIEIYDQGFATVNRCNP